MCYRYFMSKNSTKPLDLPKGFVDAALTQIDYHTDYSITSLLFLKPLLCATSLPIFLIFPVIQPLQ